jgi:hypothetical protein
MYRIEIRPNMTSVLSTLADTIERQSVPVDQY